MLTVCNIGKSCLLFFLLLKRIEIQQNTIYVQADGTTYWFYPCEQGGSVRKYDKANDVWSLMNRLSNKQRNAIAILHDQIAPDQAWFTCGVQIVQVTTPEEVHYKDWMNRTCAGYSPRFVAMARFCDSWPYIRWRRWT